MKIFRVCSVLHTRNIFITILSSKIKEMARIRATSSGDKMIVVSQFTSLLDILQPLIKEMGFKYTRLDGKLNMHQKSEVCEKFQNTKDVDSPNVLLLSLRAGKINLIFNIV